MIRRSGALGHHVLISAVVSLTLTPMMCARLLRPHAPRAAGPALPLVRARLRPDHRGLRYEPCAGCSATSLRPLRVAVATLGLTVMLYLVVPKGFFPVQDTGTIQGISEARRRSRSRRWPRGSRPWLR